MKSVVIVFRSSVVATLAGALLPICGPSSPCFRCVVRPLPPSPPPCPTPPPALTVSPPLSSRTPRNAPPAWSHATPTDTWCVRRTTRSSTSPSSTRSSPRCPSSSCRSSATRRSSSLPSWRWGTHDSSSFAAPSPLSPPWRSSQVRQRSFQSPFDGPLRQDHGPLRARPRSSRGSPWSSRVRARSSPVRPRISKGRPRSCQVRPRSCQVRLRSSHVGPQSSQYPLRPFDGPICWDHSPLSLPLMVLSGESETVRPSDGLTLLNTHQVAVYNGLIAHALHVYSGPVLVLWCNISCWPFQTLRFH